MSAAPTPDEAGANASPDGRPPIREPLLVRLGVRYFQTLSSGGETVATDDAIHLLNPAERKALRRIQRGAILRAAAAGAVSTIVAAAAEVIATRAIGAGQAGATFGAETRVYAIVAVATIVTSILEILYLYWDGLRAVHELSGAAGLDLFPEQDSDKALAGAMARAALELPNPTRSLFGIDPRREASKLRLFVASIVYKLKISVTNFLMKTLVRRMLGRALVRGWLPFVAVPFTALWNALICWLIMREARIRAMGPSAARQMVDAAFKQGAANRTGNASEGERTPTKLTTAGRGAVLRAVASSIVRTQDLHPNLAALLHEIAGRVCSADALDGREPLDANDDGGALDDTSAFLACLTTLDSAEQALTLRVLTIASIIDGRVTRAEKRLLIEARRACGRSPEIREVETLRRAFVRGDLDPLSIAKL